MKRSGETRIHHLLQTQVALRAEAIAIQDSDGRQISWQLYHALALDKARQMRGLGARAGDRVLLVSENCVAAAVIVMACGMIDAVAVPVDARLSEAEIARIHTHCDPRLAFYTVTVSRAAAVHADRAGATAQMSGCGALYAQTFAPQRAPEAVVGGAEQTAVILYATGAEGRPMGVMLSHANLLFAADAARWLRDLGPEDRVFGALALSDVFGLVSMQMATARAGACMQLVTGFSPQAVLGAVQGGVTVLSAVPGLHAQVLACAEAQGCAGPEGLRHVESVGAPLDAALQRRASAFYATALHNGYGTREATGMISATRGTQEPGSNAGLPLPGVALQLDESASPEPGVGEVLTRGPHVMQGYYRNALATAAVMTPDGFLRTGDLGRIDTQGQLHVLGRIGDVIRRAGVRVYPARIEAALNEHPDVVQSAVIGSGRGEVLAFVQCLTQVPCDSLHRFVATLLAAQECPSRIFVVDALPATPTGKVLRGKLLSHFADLLVAH